MKSENTKQSMANYFYAKRLVILIIIFLLAFTSIRAPKEFNSTIQNVKMVLADTIVDSSKIYTKVEIESSYPGGEKAWIEYLNKNLKYPDAAISDEIQGDVIIQFIVDVDGKVSDVKASSGPVELRIESIRVIKNSGKWIPALQDGKYVKSYKRQPIKFRVEVQKKKK
jgi:TonB family protein